MYYTVHKYLLLFLIDICRYEKLGFQHPLCNCLRGSDSIKQRVADDYHNTMPRDKQITRDFTSLQRHKIKTVIR